MLQVDGFSIATVLEKAVLQDIADATGGTYREADDAASLASVYDSIELNWTMRTVPHEVTSSSPRSPVCSSRPRRPSRSSVRAGWSSVVRPAAALTLALAAPILLGAYVWQLRRRQRHGPVLQRRPRPCRCKRTQVVASARVPSSSPAWPSSGLRRLARRCARTCPSRVATILIALDVSGSMCATDVAPNRLTAAQAAVRDFVEEQPRRRSSV